MKKLFLMLAILLMTSCSAQNLDGGTYLPPVDVTATMTLTQVDENTATFVTKAYGRIFEVDAKADMVQGYEYVVRLVFPRNTEPVNGVLQAKLIGYTISPGQAAKNSGGIRGKKI